MDVNNAGIYVKILDKEFQVACPEGSETELSEAAAYLDQQMQTIRKGGKIVGVERIAIMAALNIAHEMLAEQRQNDEYIKHIDERVISLVEQLQDAISNIGTEKQEEKSLNLETNLYD